MTFIIKLLTIIILLPVAAYLAFWSAVIITAIFAAL